MVTNNPVPPKGGSLLGATTINWEDAYKGDNVLWRVPRNIRYGDNVVVRQDETAVFFRDGKVLAYLDRPDRYALTSLNAGIIGNLIQALSGVRQEAEVYYLQRRIFDGKFGSRTSASSTCGSSATSAGRSAHRTCSSTSSSGPSARSPPPM